MIELRATTQVCISKEKGKREEMVLVKKLTKKLYRILGPKREDLKRRKCVLN